MNIENNSGQLNKSSVPIEKNVENIVSNPENTVSIDLISSKLPRVQSNLYGPIEGKQIKDKVNFLENEEKKINELMNQAILLDEKKAVQTQDIINQIAFLTVEKILLDEKDLLSSKDHVDIDSQLISFLEKDELFERKEEKTNIEAVDFLSPGSIAIVSLLLINQMKQIIKLKEENLSLMGDLKDPVLEKEILLLKNWVKLQSETTNNRLNKMGVQSILSSPKGIAAILNLANVSSSVLSNILGWAGLGLGIISQVRSLRKKQGEFNQHKAWTEVIKNSGMTEDDAKKVYKRQKIIFVNRNKSNLEARDALIKPLINELKAAVNKLPKDKEKVILETRNKLMEAGIEIFVEPKMTVKEMSDFLSNDNRNFKDRDDLIKPLIEELTAAENYSKEEQEKVILKTRNKLRDLRIEILVEPKMTVEEMDHFLSDAVNQWNFNKMMVQKKEALSVSLRNGLRTLANKKEKIDKGFLTLALNKTKVIFSATIAVTALTIVLKVLTIVGIVATATATAAISATGFGMLAIGISFTIIGAIYLYVKKPNIFKTYLKGIQLQLLFWRIPLAIKTQYRNYTLFQSNKISEEISLIGNRILEVESLLKSDESASISEYLKKKSKNKKISGDVKEILKGHIEELKQNKKAKEAELVIRDKKMVDLSQSIEKFSEKIKVLQKNIDEAGWKDFQRLLNKEKSKEVDEVEILTEHLLKDATLLEDNETRKVLNHMNVDLRKARSQDLRSIKRETSKALRTFFSIDEEATLHLIKKQTLMAKHGLQ